MNDPVDTSESSTSSSQEADAPNLGERVLAGVAGSVSRGLSRLPRERSLRIARGVGRWWVRLGGPRTADGLTNLRIAFPEWSEARRRRLLEHALANLAAGAVEFATMMRLDPQTRLSLADVEGLEHLERAQAQSPTGGVVVLTAHYGAWELLVSIMAAHGLPIAVVHRARDNPLFDRIVGLWRGSSGVELLPRGSAARAALRALRRGRLLAMTLDQDCPRREGVFVPFLGRLACTRDGPARIALHARAPVVPVFIERIGDTERHRVRVEPPLELLPASADRPTAVEQNVARMAAAVEAAIRRAPENWVWIHRRWRTQPLGEPRPYRRDGWRDRWRDSSRDSGRDGRRRPGWLPLLRPRA